MNQSAQIIVVASEVLDGRRREKNINNISKALTLHGIAVSFATVCPDRKREITSALQQARERLVIVTGGLGSTEDDMTREIVAQSLDRELVVSEASRKRIESKLLEREIPFTDRYLKMCRVPAGAETLNNPSGLADAVFIPGSLNFLLLPGVPSELTSILQAHLEDVLQRVFPERAKRKTWTFGAVGIGESELEDRISGYPHFEKNEISILPSLGRVYVTTRNRELADDIRKHLSEIIFTETGEKLEEAVLRLLSERKEILALAESCTGGAIASGITSLAGASAVLRGGIIAYSNSVKEEVLGVPGETLASHGAVSEETARAMAEGARKLLQSDWSLSVTGIAGPDGGTTEKPVGTVWIACSGNEKTLAQHYHFRGDRNSIQARSVVAALQMLWKQLRTN